MAIRTDEQRRTSARKLDEGALVANAKLGGATPLWEWIDDGATVFSY